VVKYGIVDPFVISDLIWYPQWNEYRNIHWEKRLRQPEFLAIGESIRTAGKIYNPVLLYTTEELTGIFWGGSRVYYARKYNIPLPAIISDKVGRFDLPMITEEEVFLMLPREYLYVDYLGIYPKNHQDLGKAMVKWRDKTTGGVVELDDIETRTMERHPAYERVEDGVQEERKEASKKVGRPKNKVM
jgi:hypothetical protein